MTLNQFERILAEQGGAWYYKPNLGHARFGPMRLVKDAPSLVTQKRPTQQLMDLTGSGQPKARRDRS